MLLVWAARALDGRWTGLGPYPLRKMRLLEGPMLFVGFRARALTIRRKPWLALVATAALFSLQVQPALAQSLNTLDIPVSEHCAPQTGPVAQLYQFGGYTLETYQFFDYRQTITLRGARLWAPDGSSLCWWWDGMKYPTVQSPGGPPVGSDLNGNGIPDLLVTMNPQHNGCEHDTYIIELGEEPRLLFRSESWRATASSPDGHAWCYLRVESLERPGAYNLIISDESFSGSGEDSVIPCMTPYLPVVFAPDADGIYRVVDPTLADPLMAVSSFRRAYWESLGYQLTRYATSLAPDSEYLDLLPRPTTECTSFSVAMLLLYTGEEEDLVRRTVAAMYPEGDAAAIVQEARERAARSELVGERFR